MGYVQAYVNGRIEPRKLDENAMLIATIQLTLQNKQMNKYFVQETLGMDPYLYNMTEPTEILKENWKELSLQKPCNGNSHNAFPKVNV